jgi:hypothetical protein
MCSGAMKLVVCGVGTGWVYASIARFAGGSPEGQFTIGVGADSYFGIVLI